MKQFIVFILVLATSLPLFAQESLFEMYATADKSKKPAIFVAYIKQYANKDVDALLVDINDPATLETEVKDLPHEYTEDITTAVNAVTNGKKVIFFIESYVWGGLETGSTFSGSWQLAMPNCSGFYWWSNKAFKNEGLNYHCGKKDKAYVTKFYIMN